MSQLSDLRINVTSTYAVNEDGSQGDLIEQTEPRYSAPGLAFSSATEALSSVFDATNEEVASVPTATDVEVSTPAADEADASVTDAAE
jgi:hypothetical protein